MALSQKQQQFIRAMAPYARRFEQKTGIPAAWAIAMAANETGWDASNPVLFGIKGTSPSGKSGSFATWEDYGKGREDIVDRFATYNDPGEAFDHLAQEMGTERYRNAPKTNVADFAAYLKRQGWATDPAYPTKIASIAATVSGGSTPSGSPDVGGLDGAPQGRAGNTTAALDAIMDRVASLEKRRSKLDQELSALEAERAKIDPRSWMAAQAKDAEIAAKRKEIAGTDTQINQAYGQQATTSRALDQMMNVNQTSLSNQIATGRLTLDRAKSAWDNVLSNAATLMKAAPMAGTPKMTEAIRQSIMNYGQFGIKPVDIGELPLIPLSMASSGGGMLPQAEEAPYRAAMMNAVKATAEPMVLDPKSGIVAGDSIDDMARKLFGDDEPEGPLAETMTDREAMGRSTALGFAGLGKTANPYQAEAASPYQQSEADDRPAAPSPGPVPSPTATPAADGGADELPPQMPGESDDDYVQRLSRMYGLP